MNENHKKSLEDIKREALAQVNASGWADNLKLAGIRQNPNGSVTLSFVPEQFKHTEAKTDK